MEDLSLSAQVPQLIVLCCPTCGGNVKIMENENTAVCAYCGNLVVPQKFDNGSNKNTSDNNNIVNSLKNPSTIEAYITHFYEDFNWSSFVYSSNLYIKEIDILLKNIQNTAADDAKTWEISFNSLHIKIDNKIIQLKKLLKDAKELFKKDKSEAFGNYAIYLSIAKKLKQNGKNYLSDLKKYKDRAIKYGLDAEKQNKLENKVVELEKAIDSLENKENLLLYEDIKNIERTTEEKYIQEKLSEGIDVREYYAKAEYLLLKDKKEALKILSSIENYKDASEIIKKINEHFVVQNVIKHDDKLLFFRKNNNGISLYNTKDKEIHKSLVDHCSKILSTYGDKIYYLTPGGNLQSLNLINNKVKNVFKEKNLSFYGTSNNVIFLKQENSSDLKKYLYKFIPATETLEKINNSFVNCFLKYDLKIHGFVNNNCIYATNNPNAYNFNLYVKNIESKDQPLLLEKNIYKFINIIGNEIFYIIGSAYNQTLICINIDGSKRRELPIFVKNVLFKKYGWFYYLVGDKYNTALYKSKLDGSDFCRIAVGVYKFVKFEDEYIYYIDDDAQLCRVFQNGFGHEVLCKHVADVASVSKTEIVLLSNDSKEIKSLYCIHLDTNLGKHKLAYNVSVAKQYNENEIFYVQNNDAPCLYKFDLRKFESELILRMHEENGCYIATCVYGSYDCPHVWTLRRYRDYKLAKTWYGRAFIKIYYALSPTLVKWFGKTKWFKKLWQNKLDRMVKSLQEKGFKSTPYKDKTW